MKILIVEDELVTALKIRDILVGAGHDVVAITVNFEQALSAAKLHTPDLAIIDVLLEESARDGIATAMAILKIHKMPILYLTANSDEQTFLAAKGTSPAAYLLKPFRSEELKFQVEIAYHNFQTALKRSIDLSGSVYLPVNKGYKKIETDNVLYLNAEGSYVEVFLLGKEVPYLISTNLGNLAQYFTTFNFYRLSRSTVINLHHLERFESNHLFMTGSRNTIRIPLSNRKELMNKLMVVKTK